MSVECHLSQKHNHSNRATYITSQLNALTFLKRICYQILFRKRFSKLYFLIYALIPPVTEPPNLMTPRSARLPLDTKHSRENTKLLGFVGHTPEENPKIHIFATRITNKRIKLTSFLTISYITFNTTSEYNICYYTAKSNHIIRVMNNLI